MIQLPEEIREKNFLVVDDYESIRFLVAEQLREMGVTKIRMAKSGNEALAIINDCVETEDAIEVLLTDLVMEDGSGLDLVKALRSNPAFKSLPILMITSKADVNPVLACVQAGVSTYIVKPWKIEDLYNKIFAFLTRISKPSD